MLTAFLRTRWVSAARFAVLLGTFFMTAPLLGRVKDSGSENQCRSILHYCVRVCVFYYTLLYIYISMLAAHVIARRHPNGVLDVSLSLSTILLCCYCVYRYICTTLHCLETMRSTAFSRLPTSSQRRARPWKYKRKRKRLTEDPMMSGARWHGPSTSNALSPMNNWKSWRRSRRWPISSCWLWPTFCCFHFVVVEYVL